MVAGIPQLRPSRRSIRASSGRSRPGLRRGPLTRCGPRGRFGTTTIIKTKLAAEHLASLDRIHVETDEDGVVWLSGNASSHAAADKVVAIARATAHVKAVHSDVTIKKDE